MSRFYLGMLTPMSLDDQEEGIFFFSLLKEKAPLLLPQKYGNWEPLQYVFKKSNVGEVVQAWRDGLFWKNGKSRVNGTVWVNHRNNMHASFAIEGAAEGIKQDDLLNVLSCFSRRYCPDFAYLHLLNADDIEKGRLSGVIHTVNKARNEVALIISTNVLRKYLPEVFWGMVFGPSYVKMFGREKLLNSPVYRVEELGDEVIYVQLTESIFDLESIPDEIDLCRKRLKMHLGLEFFFDADKEGEYKYSVPDFNFN